MYDLILLNYYPQPNKDSTAGSIKSSGGEGSEDEDKMKSAAKEVCIILSVHMICTILC